MQWNIGGGKLLREGTDPTLLKSFTKDGLEEIIKVIKEKAPDIITLQETHASKGSSQAQSIAESLGYTYWYNDEYAQSHIEDGQRLGQAIISRFPVVEHSFQLFNNPNFEVIWEDGSFAKSHDKGRTRCKIRLPDGALVVVQTFHAVPFRRFKIDPKSEEAKTVLNDMSSKLLTSGQKSIIQADFNIDADKLEELFPLLFSAGFKAAFQPNPTTTRGHTYDCLLSDGVKILECEVFKNVLTDHFPLITTLDV